jgi:membrane-bound lytic murein transglycosylase B
VRVSAEAAAHIAGTIPRRAGGCQAKRDMSVVLPVAEWQRLGVRQTDGRNLPDEWPDGALVSGTSRFFLVHHNYDALLEYNCAHSYAVGVGLLAAGIRGDDAPPAPKTAARKKAAPASKKKHTSHTAAR